jgi:hypothetical protein
MMALSKRSNQRAGYIDARGGYQRACVLISGFSVSGAEQLIDWRCEPKPELKTGRVVEYFDLRAVETRHGCNQAQAKAVARNVAAVF